MAEFFKEDDEVKGFGVAQFLAILENMASSIGKMPEGPGMDMGKAELFAVPKRCIRQFFDAIRERIEEDNAEASQQDRIVTRVRLCEIMHSVAASTLTKFSESADAERVASILKLDFAKLLEDSKDDVIHAFNHVVIARCGNEQTINGYLKEKTQQSWSDIFRAAALTSPFNKRINLEEEPNAVVKTALSAMTNQEKGRFLLACARDYWETLDTKSKQTNHIVTLHDRILEDSLKDTQAILAWSCAQERKLDESDPQHRRQIQTEVEQFLAGFAAQYGYDTGLLKGSLTF